MDWEIWWLLEESKIGSCLKSEFRAYSTWNITPLKNTKDISIRISGALKYCAHPFYADDARIYLLFVFSQIK